MPNFLEYLRQQNIFRPQSSLPYPANPISRDIGMGMGMGGMSIPTPMGDTNSIPPPQFGMPGIEAPDMGRQNPFQNITFGKGPLDINQGDMAAARMPIPGQGMPETELSASARMKELYQPQTDASNRFDELIARYPQEDEPSWLRRIGAMIVDYTKGSKAGEQFFHQPYEQKVEEWKNKIGPAQSAANLERYENVNQRTLAYQQMSIELREKAQEAKETNDIRRADILQQRADIYAFKTTHPDWKLILPKGGNVQAINPQTLETHDTGISTGSMSKLDEITLSQENALERIGATGAESRQTEGVRQTGRMEAIGARGEESRRTRETVPGGVGGQSILPTQMKVSRFNKANELVNSRPDLAPFIKPGQGANEFRIIAPNPNAWTDAGKGPTAQQYAEIVSFIYGPTGGRNAGAGPGPATTSPNSGTIRVEVNGKRFRFKGTPQEAQAAGYKVIGQ